MTPAAVAPRLDADKVTAWLQAQLPEPVRPPLRFAPIGHGRSNLTFRVDAADGRSWVLRRPPLGPLLASAHDMRREHRVLDRLAAAGAPVPAPLALCTDHGVTGADFYVMEHVEGAVVHTRAAAERLDPAARHAAGLSLMATLARLHAFDVDAIGLGDLGSRESYAERQLRRWGRQWELSKTTENPRLERVADRLAAAVPPQDEVALVHGDFRLDNVVVDDAGAIRAVLDWELCTLGDPLADLGLLVAYTPSGEDDVLPVDEGVMLLPGFPSIDELVEEYARASGRALDALPFWVALGYWKIAVILQGVYKRWLQDPLNGGRDAGQLEPVVERLSHRAEAAVKEARLG
jgi:aminoglycoside phosphotransferase (APT) family kinase protein